MGSLRSAVGVAILLLPLAAPTLEAGEQARAGPPRSQKSVYGTLESVDRSLNSVFMKSNSGERVAWRFGDAVVEEVARFKPGDAMIVIYRQVTPSEKRATAIAFPGTAPAARYVNKTGSRVMLRSAPDIAGVCGQPGATPVTDSTIPDAGTGEASGACWCCAPAGGSCTPGNKTGQGIALLVSCFE